MKKTIAVSFALLGFLIGLNAVSQNINDEDTPDIDKRSALNVFGGLLAEPGLINQELSFSMGATLGLTYADHYYIGGYYVALVSQHFRDDIESSTGNLVRTRTSFNHGGFVLGYFLKPEALMNANFFVRGGWGSIWYFDPTITNADRLDELYKFTKDRLFVLTPGVEYTLTPISWLKIGLGLGYRMTFGYDREGYSNADFDSPVGSITISFGNFKEAVDAVPDNSDESEGVD